MANIYGRQVVMPLTNKSGGGVVAGDVVIIDTGNDNAFTTTTSGQYQGSVGIAQETIANNASGRVLVHGYAALVNVPSSMTRGRFLETHTVAKQATQNTTRRAGSFGQYLTGGTTPTAWLWGFPDNAGASGETVATSTIWDAAGDLAMATGADTAAKLTKGSDGTYLHVDPTTHLPAYLTSTYKLGTTSAGASFATGRGLYVKKITVPQAGTILSVAAFVKGNGTNYEGMFGAVYTDSGGAPINILALSGPMVTATASAALAHAIINTTVREFTMPVCVPVAAADYWIGIAFQNNDGSSLSLAYNSASGSDKTQLAGGDSIKDSSVAAFSNTTNDYCIYANVLR